MLINEYYEDIQCEEYYNGEAFPVWEEDALPFEETDLDLEGMWS